MKAVIIFFTKLRHFSKARHLIKPLSKCLQRETKRD